MSFKSKVIAAAATLTLVGGAAATMASGPANAATPSCGHRCINLFSKKFSDVLTTKPPFVLDVWRQGANINQPIIMFQSSNADPAEDFTVSLQGTVAQFAAAGLLPTGALTLHYAADEAVEYQYSPNGVDSGLCVGVASTPIANTPVSLQPCGASAKTVWIVDTNRHDLTPGGLFTFPYVPLINAASLNFSNPYVLTYPPNANPNDRPRAQLVTQNLHKFSRGQIFDNQLWSAFFGVLR